MFPFIKFLHPHLLLEKIKSHFNGTIEVYSEFGQPRITVDNMPQSGGIVTDILKTSLKHFSNPKNFLLLGLGGGDILHHIRRRWPECHITAVEIDPVMITIAKNYFKIDQIPNLKVFNADALKFTKNSTTAYNPKPTTYDAILVDCYLGRQIPSKLEGLEFLMSLKKILSRQGVIAFNRLSKSENDLFTNNLHLIFPKVNLFKNYCNLLLIARI